jgi:small subunit ribosomal protein S6
LYVLIQFSSTPDLVKEVERRLRVADSVIKFITVRMDEEEKRADKIKAIRATRKKLSAQPAAAAPDAETAPATTEAAASA